MFAGLRGGPRYRAKYLIWYNVPYFGRIVLLHFLNRIFARSEDDNSNISVCGLEALRHASFKSHKDLFGVHHASISVWTVKNRDSLDASLLLLPLIFLFLAHLILIGTLFVLLTDPY